MLIPRTVGVMDSERWLLELNITTGDKCREGGEVICQFLLLCHCCKPLKVSSALGPGSGLKLGVSGITLSVLISSPTSGKAPNCERDTSSRRPDSEKPGDCEGEGTESRGAGEAGSG